MPEIVIKNNEEPSKRFKLNKEDMLKVAKGAGIAAGAAALTYLAELIPSLDFGVYTAATVAVLGVAINLGRKFLANANSN